MKSFIFIFSLIISANCTFGQNAEYHAWVKKAESLYDAKDYKNSGLAFSEAFKAFGWNAKPADYYNAACSWALANIPDSAFFQLDRMATKFNYSNYPHISIDADLNSLHSDSRWPALLNIIRKNKEEADAKLDKPLVTRLDTIYLDDQEERQKIDGIMNKFGWDSKEMRALLKVMHEKDSINVIKVSAILDSRGWLGIETIGEQGNSTLFLVVQHADFETQVKYLPMMREAVKNGNAKGGNLALLEDRVALGQGKKQIYGSQIGMDNETQLYYVSPLADPDNVDKRRAEVGLEPIAEYVSFWQIKWDVDQYKKDLPKYIEMEGRMK